MVMEESSYWATIFRRKVSRRGLLKTVVLGGTAIGFSGSLGCSSSPQQTVSKTSTSTEPKRGGIYRTYNDTDAPDLDMHTQLSYATATPMGYVYDPLMRWAADRNPDGTFEHGKFFPWIAESWETPDETTWVFKIRSGVKFHALPPVNGRELTAEDVKWSIERITTPKPEFARASMLQPIQSIEVVDNYTVKFKLAEPFAPLLINLADGWNVMAAKEVVAKDGDLKTTAIGTGAFYLDKWNRGVSFEFKKHPEFFMKGFPYLDGVRMTLIQDKGTRLANMRAGELDVLGSLFASEAESLKQGISNLQVHSTYAGHPWIFMNTKRPPFDDKNVRKAVQHATNVQDYIDMLWEGKGKRNGPMNFYLNPWALPESDLPTFDLKLAKEYMAKSAYPNGAKVQSDVSEVLLSSSIMQIAQGQWKEIGLEVELQMLDWGAYMRKVGIQRDYFVSAVSDWVYVDPNEWLYTYFHTKGTNNRCNYNNPEFDKLVEEQRRTMDEKKRVELVLSAQRMLLEDAPHVDLASYESFSTYQPYVRNTKTYTLPAGGNSSFTTYDMWLDK